METCTNKGVSCFIHNSDKYRQYYVKKNKNVCWRCTHKACKARIETRDGTVVSEYGFHCHNQKVVNASATALRIACKRKASEHLMERPQKIIRTALQETNSEQNGEVTHQDVNNFRAAIYRERRKKYGRLPKTLHETLATLRSMPLSTHRKEDMLMLCEEINGKGFVIFTTKLNLQTLCSADTVLMDGTFKSCPKPFCQLYTILAYVNTFYIPLVFALLPDKTQSTYETLFHHVLTQCEVTGLQFEPECVLMDFERAAMNAVEAKFSQTRLIGCRFHLGQSWWRRIQSLGLSDDYRQHSCTTSKWLKRFFGLSLLPCDEVPDSFTEDIMFDMPDDVRCRQFADYVVDNFVATDSDFPPTLWAHAPDIMPVTTNGAESYHGHLNAQFNAPHPNIYVFVEVLLRQQAAIPGTQ